MWLFIVVSLKINKQRSLPVLPSYLKQGLVFTLLVKHHFPIQNRFPGPLWEPRRAGLTMWFVERLEETAMHGFI